MSSPEPATIPGATLSPARVRFAIFALALGGFGIGLTEFVALGLLPNIANDLLPSLYVASPSKAVAQAGLLASAYALGVVVGAPTIAALAARFPRKQLLMACVAVFALGTVASALLPTFGLVLAARFIAALPHGAYFGIAALVAASLMGPGKRARGVAIVLSGLTISNVIGVPAITFLGQSAGWRVAYLVVAAVFVVTFFAVWLALPQLPGNPEATMRRELGAFKRSHVWYTLLLGSLGFGGFFAIYTYVAPVVTNVTNLSPSAVPIALVCIGLGMTFGNLAGGRAADHHVMGTIFVCFGIFAIALLGYALTAQWPVGLFVFIFVIGFAAAALSPAIQTRLMDVAGDAQTLAAAINHSALNLGNSLGALLGGVAIAAGLGYLSPAWVGLALCVPGAFFAILSAAMQKRSGLPGVTSSASAESELPGQVGFHENAVLDSTLP